MRIVCLALGLMVLCSCVSSRQFKELEAKKEDQQRRADSLQTLAQNCGADLADARQQNGQLTKQLEQLQTDTTQQGLAFRQNQQRLLEAKKQNSLLEENYSKLLAGRESETSALMAELRSTRERLQNREDSLNSLATTLERKAAQMEELQAILDQKDKDVQLLRQRVASALKGFEGSGLSIDIRQGKVYVSMDEKLLFASGSTEVGSQGKDALQKLADVLAKDSTIQVMIEGHTDDVPLRPGARFADNWDLSVLRATSIVRLLTANPGVAPDRLIAAGRGEFVPVAPNDSPENKAKNRRTEIILTPKLDALFEILE